jgi:hypothetical protein
MCKSLECNMHSTCMSEIGAPPLYLTLYFLRTKRIVSHILDTHSRQVYTKVRLSSMSHNHESSQTIIVSRHKNIERTGTTANLRSCL